MIELEVPCCGEPARLSELVDEIRCEACGVVAELAPDPAPDLLAVARIAAVAA